MGDILSQSEIDDLLAQLIAGEINANELKNNKQEKKVKKHDFKRPSKFAKEHLRTLQIIQENYARLITNFLSGYLRTLVQIDVISMEAVQFSEFTNSIANPAVLAIINFNPLPGNIILDISPVLAYALIERVLGGKGGNKIEKVRGFTEIEIAILMRIISQMLTYMREPWENVVEVHPTLSVIETNAQFVQIINPTEMVALATFNVKVGEVEGFMNLCIPHMVMEPVMDKLSTKIWFSIIEKETDEETKLSIEKKVEQTQIPVTAVLGRTTLTVAEFLELQVGDVLQLDTRVDGDIQVLVGPLHKFNGKPGVKNKKIAVKVTGVVRREDE
ncbi:flagellar motor switch protein FliM [Thermoclostridium stercorarium subsp. stercorarium DSM 8532]|uniref:Flagellar motor switch protein FliM n=3 Tax=Thermoclostridium stercorarium TaxID=1510 RepID=L7VM76_THES1|nr:flagellar motor switch protein FliM [Thermoclostridium stercorarium]AGC67596.1 flagellar motor switch protein FliM [Thermoclostridium stercorarium subsp. stercorarium DSM 8532]AGI38646.1 FliM [Thermoclostridium stercorarium subsp. stercorarium DSM 8532]ANW98018.1 flagellar motor switch protein FliM [Thermoclostridium stercorarium subsp. thermolacticum DSM 2910]ANX00566.1 flagellar motor switch protein FliM [Thermoclostridium stercorarium subsp. leptospartum DSM 9219]UZQ86178.1 flagellar mot